MYIYIYVYYTHSGRFWHRFRQVPAVAAQQRYESARAVHAFWADSGTSSGKFQQYCRNYLISAIAVHALWADSRTGSGRFQRNLDQRPSAI